MAITGYKHTQKYYAEFYNVSASCIWKWKGRGHALDDPVTLLKQLSSQPQNNTADLTTLRKMCGATAVKYDPRKNRGAAQPKKVKLDLPPKRPNPFHSIQPPPPEPLPDDQDRPGRAQPPPEHESTLKGFQKELERLGQECDAAYRAYKTEDDVMLRGALWKTWKDMLDAWGKLAKLAPDAEREAGLLMKKSEVDATWSRVLKEVKSQLEALPRRMSTSLVPHVERMVSAVDVEQAAKVEVIGVMTALQKGLS